MNIYSFNGTATLAGVENGTIHNVRCGPGDIRVTANVGGIVAAKLQVERHNAACCGLSQRQAAGSRAGEADLLDLGIAGNLLDCFEIAGVQDLENAPWETGSIKRLLQSLSNQRGLW